MDKHPLRYFLLLIVGGSVALVVGVSVLDPTAGGFLGLGLPAILLLTAVGCYGGALWMLWVSTVGGRIVAGGIAFMGLAPSVRSVFADFVIAWVDRLH